VRPEARLQVEWDWQAYIDELRVPVQRVEVGRALVESLEIAIAARGLPWQATLRKGYVAFQRASAYNVLVVDVYWRRAPRLAIKIPAPPDELSLVDPYPQLEDSWAPAEREWGWTVPTTDSVPDVGIAVDLVQPFHSESGPMTIPAR
jgi:hypothetical protein